MKAHVVENNIVVNTIVVDSLDALPNLVPAEEGSIGDSYVDGKFTKPVDPEFWEERAVKSRIASRRYLSEVGGLILNQETGFKLDTTRESRETLSYIISWLEKQTEGTTISWKHADGTFEDLDVGALKTFQTQIMLHVVDSFKREKELLEAFENGTYTEFMLKEKFSL